MNEPQDYLVLNGEEVSPDSLKARAEPSTKRKPRKWWLRLILRHPILAYVLIIGGTGAILSNYWKTLDRYFPMLNELIHSDVSDQNDINYQLYKLKQSEHTYSEGIARCDDSKTSLTSCRSAYLASEPALVDIGTRIGKLDSAWQKEVAQGAMPEVCRQAGSREYGALKEWVFEEQRVMAVMKAVDPNSPPSVAEMREQLRGIGPAEKSAVAAVTSFSPWPKECAGY